MGDEKSFKRPATITGRSDGDLVRAWKSGDQRAAEVLVDRYAIRLVALVASRLNPRYQGAIDPDDVVQSAFGSFFNAANNSRIHVTQSVSLWRLLATFTRRKMARSLEHHSAIKRGGDRSRVSFDQIETTVVDRQIQDETADELLSMMQEQLPEDLLVVVKALLAGQTQADVAESLGIDERTVRRRLVRLRKMIDTEPAIEARSAKASFDVPALPIVGYHQFVLGKLIGSGGFGKVYRASMQPSGRTVSVKFLRKKFWQAAPARQSFLREINTASQIDHPAIIRYLGYGESPHGGPFVLCSWIDGRPLGEIDRPTNEQFVKWLVQICRGLEAVHAAGLVHGDLTPSNILVDNRGRIVITDFGFSQSSSTSETAILGGTPGFAAPEQIDPSFGQICPQTDFYAFGGLVHWFLYGTPPNDGRNLGDVVTKTINSRTFNAYRLANLAQPFRSVLEATLKMSPADRIATASELVGLFL